MRVKLIYLVEVPCWLAHCSKTKPGKHKNSGGAVMKHDEAKAFFGTPCDPTTLPFWQIVDESEVMPKIDVMHGLGHVVEVEYLND